jgi:hypothetical protein
MKLKLIKRPSTKKSLGPEKFTAELYKMFKEELTNAK